MEKHNKQAYGHEERGGESEMYGKSNMETYITIYEIDGLVTKSCPTLAIPWSVACKVSLSMGFSRQEYWSGQPFPSPEDLPDPGIEPESPALQAYSLLTEL